MSLQAKSTAAQPRVDGTGRDEEGCFTQGNRGGPRSPEPWRRPAERAPSPNGPNGRPDAAPSPNGSNGPTAAPPSPNGANGHAQGPPSPNGVNGAAGTEAAVTKRG